MTSNWADSYEYRARDIHSPTSIEEVQDIVATAPLVRALGTRHSFTGLADSAGVLVSLAGLDTAPVIEGSTVIVPGGMRYGELASWLHAQGWALHNLASLPHISVAGAIATGTHGSGDRNSTLSAAVAALTFVTATGEIVTVRRGDTDFDGAVVSLGALGVVVSVALDIQPTFDARQDLYDGLTWDSLLDSFDEVTSAAYSVSIFTSWQGSGVEMLWLKSRMDAAEPPATLLTATRHAIQRHMLPEQMAESTTQQGGIPGPWSDRLAHFKLEFTPSNGDELQSEYLVPRARAVEAIAAVRELRDRISPLLHITEIRTMAADSLWLSGAYETDAVGIHFTWKKLPADVLAVLPAIEAALLPLGARPHWGKVFTSLEPANYPRLGDFRALREKWDPSGKFDNDFLRTFVG
jgi:alditol oxidase